MDDFERVSSGDCCPYLGLSDDRQERFEAAHEDHACWRTGSALPIDLEHQSLACLSARYVRCPVLLYRNDRKDLVGRHTARQKTRDLKPLMSLTALLFVTSLLVMGYTAMAAFGLPEVLFGDGEPAWTATPAGYDAYLTQISPGGASNAPPELLQSLLVVFLTDTPAPPSPTVTDTPAASETPGPTETAFSTVTLTATALPTFTSPPPTSTPLLINPTRTPTITLTLRPTETPTAVQATPTGMAATDTLPAPTDIPTSTPTNPPSPTETSAPPPTPTEAPPPPPPPTQTPPPTELPSPTP